MLRIEFPILPELLQFEIGHGQRPKVMKEVTFYPFGLLFECRDLFVEKARSSRGEENSAFLTPYRKMPPLVMPTGIERRWK